MNFASMNFASMNFASMNFASMNFASMNFAGTNPFSTIHLSDIPLNYPGGWDAILQGGGPSNLPPLAGQPLETITLLTALPYLQIANPPVTMNEISIGGTILGSLPFLALLLGSTPMAQIPLSPALEGPAVTDQARLNQWCTTLTTATQNPCAALHVDTTTSALAIALTGYSLAPVSLNSILVKDVVTNRDWFHAMPLNAFAKAATAISSIPVASLPSMWFICGNACGAVTLGQAAAVNQVKPSVTLYDLFTNATWPSGTPAPVANATLGDLLQGLIPTSLLPWPSLNLSAVSLQNVASPAEPPLTYNLALNVAGDRPAATTVCLTLPPGFVTVPGTFVVDGAAQPDPTSIPNCNGVGLTLGTLNPGPHTASIETRAGLTLGAAPASATGTATAGNDSVTTAPSAAAVNVVEAAGAGEVPGCGASALCDTRTLAPDTLDIGHISTATDIDLYSFVAPAAAGTQTQASITLSNLPTTNCTDASGPLPANVGCDYDLVLYGPPSPLIRNQPTQSLTLSPVNDTPLDLYPKTSAAAPDVQQDVPINRPTGPQGVTSVIQVSAHRGTTNEQIVVGPLVAGASYYVQVSGYNGAHSPLPYALRMSLMGEPVQACAPAPARNPAWDEPGLGGPTTYGAAPHVLFLVPQHRMYTTYGGAAIDPMMASLEAAATKVGGTIVPIDNVATTAAAYSAWDANRCSPSAANDVVREIGKQVDAARAANPAIDSIVLVGDDSMLPMARVADNTLIANERDYAPEIPTQNGANELSGSLANGYLLTDNAYGTYAGVSVNDHELFVPNVALGRLVETPQDIKAAADTYVSGGTLDPSTLSSALVTGYDFMASGAQGVASALASPSVTVNKLISPPGAAAPWTTAQLLAGLFSAGGSPGITSFNGHYDATHLEAADGSIMSTTDFAKAAAKLAPPLALARHLLFSMGCHSGLSESDVSIGTPQLDWPQELTGAGQGALYAANTGFGYGDDSTVALSARLMVLYAQALATTPNVGQALAVAKQQYLASTLVLSPYDEKVLQESTFYGLPFYSLPAKAAAAAAAMAPAQASPVIAAAPLGSDPATGAPTEPLSVNLTDVGTGGPSGPNNLDEVTTPNGSYYEVNGQTLTVQNRPIEPVTGLDATQANERAHGVLITSLTSKDKTGFVPRYFRPVVDSSGTEHLLSGVGDAVFPATIAHVGQGAGKDLVTLAAGQANNPQLDGTVTQRLFTSIGGVVEYSSPSDNNFTPPQILRSSGEIVNGTVGFTVFTDGHAKRVFVLYRTAGVDGPWQGADLTAIPQADGSIRWWGGGLIGGLKAEFIVQAVDGSGNVGASDNKVSDFQANQVPQGALTVTLAPATPASGWYTSDPVIATVSGASGAVLYSLDGAPFVAYTGPVQIAGQGVHHFLAQDAAGNTGSASVAIDKVAPTVSAMVTPGPSVVHTYVDASSGNTWYDGPVTVTITGNDGLNGSGVASITSGVNAPPSTVTNGSTVAIPVTADGTYTVRYVATDVAGNVSAAGSLTFSIDTLPPTLGSCTPTPGTNVWYNANVTAQCTASDAGVGLANANDASFTLNTTVAVGSQMASAQTGTHQVCDLLGHCATFGPLSYNVDMEPPTVTISSPTSKPLTVGANVAASYSCSDTGGSGVASCVGTVANGAAIDTTPGSHVFTVTATDNAGNTTTTSVNYTVGYGICLQYNPTSPKPHTGTFPIKLELCDAAGNNLSSASITLTALYEDVPGDLPSPNFQGNSNNGFAFRFSSGLYIYNLDPTQGNPPLGPGTHTLYFSVSTSPGQVYAASFTLS
jgi:hypothetical protein